MEVILLRHGATTGNLLHQYIGRTDLPLAQVGITQAKARQFPTPELVFSSPMRRCTQTAQLVWPAVPVRLVDDLRETDFGDFECKTWADLNDLPAYRAWIDGIGECPNGESRADAAARAVSAGVQCIQAAQGLRRIAIVTHGGVIMHLLHHHLGGALYDWQPPLCGGWLVHITAEGQWENPKPL
jgi:alpha-ribazole phosphatase